ncbi:hypothetical protein [Segetibacter aerophilus]|uniref:Uncharacterized protein n=1 Tax=Segetibacter aerophilus TaxID=670293 RepID=A0A512BGC0_9BACT|nr:hypothetical protein [Segetibacter aerophilus]GEO11012.1 hypothetical protein SAE01_35080 [Segetibacter aerophilus]
MTKTIITPANNNVLLAIPDSYIGKKIEVLMYAVEELSESTLLPKTMSSYKGILTSEEAEQLQEYVKQSREEWDTSI